MDSNNCALNELLSSVDGYYCAYNELPSVDSDYCALNELLTSVDSDYCAYNELSSVEDYFQLLS